MIYTKTTWKNGQGDPAKFKKFAYIIKADEVIACLRADELAMRFLSGEAQPILTGEINGIMWKGKLDILLDTCFVDLKTARTLGKVWCKVLMPDGGKPRNVELDWYEERNYWLQLAVYQELLRQKIGKQLVPCILAVSKEDPPDKDFIAFDNQHRLDQELEFNIKNAQRYTDIKNGKVEPTAIDCDYCRSVKKLTYKTARSAIGFDENGMRRVW